MVVRRVRDVANYAHALADSLRVDPADALRAATRATAVTAGVLLSALLPPLSGTVAKAQGEVFSVGVKVGYCDAPFGNTTFGIYGQNLAGLPGVAYMKSVKENVAVTTTGKGGKTITIYSRSGINEIPDGNFNIQSILIQYSSTKPALSLGQKFTVKTQIYVKGSLEGEGQVSGERTWGTYPYIKIPAGRHKAGKPISISVTTPGLADAEPVWYGYMALPAAQLSVSVNGKQIATDTGNVATSFTPAKPGRYLITATNSAPQEDASYSVAIDVAGQRSKHGHDKRA